MEGIEICVGDGVPNDIGNDIGNEAEQTELEESQRSLGNMSNIGKNNENDVSNNINKAMTPSVNQVAAGSGRESVVVDRQGDNDPDGPSRDYPKQDSLSGGGCKQHSRQISHGLTQMMHNTALSLPHFGSRTDIDEMSVEVNYTQPSRVLATRRAQPESNSNRTRCELYPNRSASELIGRLQQRHDSISQFQRKDHIDGSRRESAEERKLDLDLHQNSIPMEKPVMQMVMTVSSAYESRSGPNQKNAQRTYTFKKALNKRPSESPKEPNSSYATQSTSLDADLSTRL